MWKPQIAKEPGEEERERPPPFNTTMTIIECIEKPNKWPEPPNRMKESAASTAHHFNVVLKFSCFFFFSFSFTIVQRPVIAPRTPFFSFLMKSFYFKSDTLLLIEIWKPHLNQIVAKFSEKNNKQLLFCYFFFCVNLFSQKSSSSSADHPWLTNWPPALRTFICVTISRRHSFILCFIKKACLKTNHPHRETEIQMDWTFLSLFCFLFSFMFVKFISHLNNKISRN